MKTDKQLKHNIENELEWEPSIEASSIGVAVHDGVVTLSGHVSSYLEKIMIEKTVRQVAGVRAIAEEMTVRYPSDKKISDDEIAARICNLFDWDVMIPKDKISVKVEHGWVTLSGAVDWQFQSKAACKLAGRIGGVVGVGNLIEIRKTPTPSDVRDKIVAAFKRNANLDSQAITVLTEGGKVTLGGRVQFWHEREIAERAAWAAPVVVEIEDNIDVGMIRKSSNSVDYG